jgi:hypothetical protein
MPMNPRLLRPRASGFNPKSISGLALWLDASDSTTVTTATGVSEWRDKSGNGRNFTQTTENNQPALTANARNGRAVLTLDGTNDSLSGPAGFSLTSTHSVFAVVNPSVRKIAAFLAGSVNVELIYGDGSSSFSGTKFAAFGVARAVYGGGTITTGTYQVVSAVCSGGTLPSNLSMWTNGVGGPVSTETAGTAPVAAVTSPLSIGTSAASQFWNGVIAEIVIYDRSLSTADRQSVERWLGRKWGVSVA